MTCQNEVRILRLSLDNISKERDKLKIDLLDANQRATMLAHEVDEQNARMEKSSIKQIQMLEQKWAEQMREMQEQVEQEKEAGRGERDELANTIVNNVNKFKEEEGRLKAELATTLSVRLLRHLQGPCQIFRVIYFFELDIGANPDSDICEFSNLNLI